MSGIYIHIPFCKQRCVYCDFYKEIADDEARIDRYIQALIREIQQRKDYLPDKKIATIYFGGGTPSVLSYRHFKAIFDVLHEYYNIDAEAEITLEANPDDLNEEYLRLLATLPFNRLSVGIQTFNDKLLKLLNRRHDAKEAISALEMVRKYDFNNISIDLIYALPNQNLEDWKSDLSQAFALNPEHISAYGLSYEKGTELWKMRKEGFVHETEDELSLAMFDYMRLIMREKGYETYEISNYAKPHYRSKHNSAYWKFISYLGLGPSAHSFDGKARQWNVSSEKIYIEKIENEAIAYHKEILSQQDLYNDYIMVALRTSEGIDLQYLQSTFDDEYHQYCMQQVDNQIKNNNIILENDRLFLSEKGIHIANPITVELMKTD